MKKTILGSTFLIMGTILFAAQYITMNFHPFVVVIMFLALFIGFAMHFEEFSKK